MVDTTPRVEARHERFVFSGVGEIYSFTTLQETPQTHDEQAPYVLALVKLNEGPMVLAQVTDLDGGELKIGDAVEMVTRKLTTEGERGMIVYGYKFRKIIERT